MRRDDRFLSEYATATRDADDARAAVAATPRTGRLVMSLDLASAAERRVTLATAIADALVARYGVKPAPRTPTAPWLWKPKTEKAAVHRPDQKPAS